MTRTLLAAAALASLTACGGSPKPAPTASAKPAAAEPAPTQAKPEADTKPAATADAKPDTKTAAKPDRENNPFVVGQTLLLSTFDPEPRTVAEGVPTNSLDRSNWAKSEFLVPVDGVRHYPTYRFLTTSRDRDYSARSRGVFPTYENALDTTHQSWGGKMADAGITTVYAAVELVTLPVFLFIDPPMATRYSPHREYERTSGKINYFKDTPDPITGNMPGAVNDDPKGPSTTNDVPTTETPVTESLETAESEEESDQ